MTETRHGPSSAPGEAYGYEDRGIRVSCRIFEIAFKHLPDVGLTVEQWCEGLSMSAEHLANPRATISWEQTIALVLRLQDLLGGPQALEDYVARDYGYVKSGSLLGLLKLATGPMNLYRMFAWAQRSLAAQVNAELEIVDKDHIRIHQSVGEDLLFPEVMWTVIKAQYRGLPLVLGLPESHVTTSGSNRNRIFDIELPHSTAMTARLRRAWDAFWGTPSSFDLLRTQMGELVRHYEHGQAESERREHAEAQLRRAQRLEAIGELAGGVAHDFNNVLMVVSSTLELMELEVPDQPQITALLQEARAAVDAGTSLTTSLLTFSRRSAAKPEPCDLREVIEQSATVLRRLLPKGVTLDVAIGPGTWVCEVDRGQLQNALLNLVVNSGHALGDEGHVEIALDKAEADKLRLTVSDNGPGMSADVLAQAVDPFFTTKPTGEGSGLGLAMVDAFARDSHGALSFDTTPGAGCRISLVLPTGE